jgi:hypothetical protein
MFLDLTPAPSRPSSTRSPSLSRTGRSRRCSPSAPSRTRSRRSTNSGARSPASTSPTTCCSDQSPRTGVEDERQTDPQILLRNRPPRRDKPLDGRNRRNRRLRRRLRLRPTSRPGRRPAMASSKTRRTRDFTASCAWHRLSRKRRGRCQAPIPPTELLNLQPRWLAHAVTAPPRDRIDRRRVDRDVPRAVPQSAAWASRPSTEVSRPFEAPHNHRPQVGIELPRVRWRLWLLSLKNVLIPVLVFVRGESAAGRVQAGGVEPVDPFQGRELDV